MAEFLPLSGQGVTVPLPTPIWQPVTDPEVESAYRVGYLAGWQAASSSWWAMLLQHRARPDAVRRRIREHGRTKLTEWMAEASDRLTWPPTLRWW